MEEQAQQEGDEEGQEDEEDKKSDDDEKDAIVEEVKEVKKQASKEKLVVERVLSESEQTIFEITKMKLQIEKDSLLKGRKNKLDDFDSKIKELKTEKSRLDIELK